MTRLNPSRLRWTAPTENIDNTPIMGPLSYRLNVDGVAFLDFPGTLNADGSFGADVTPMAISGGAHTLTLQAFYTEQPTLLSDISNAIDVVLGVAAPKAPLALSAD